MFHHEAWNCYNSKTRGPVSPKVHRQDESPALNRLMWYLSTIVRAPPSENRKCNVLILCSTPTRFTIWINIRLWWCFSVKIVRFHLTTNPGAMVIRLETEGNCWGLEKPKKIMKFGRHDQDTQSLLKPWTKLQWWWAILNLMYNFVSIFEFIGIYVPILCHTYSTTWWQQEIPCRL